MINHAVKIQYVLSNSPPVGQKVIGWTIRESGLLEKVRGKRSHV